MKRKATKHWERFENGPIATALSFVVFTIRRFIGIEPPRLDELCESGTSGGIVLDDEDALARGGR